MTTPPGGDFITDDASDGSLGLALSVAATLSAAQVLQQLGCTPDGLTTSEVARRRAVVGANLIAIRRVRILAVLGRQLRSALLLLLVVTATISFFVGDRTDAVIIGVILIASVGLGFVNEYRAELAAQALHLQIRHQVTVRRDGASQSVDVSELVPGDLVMLEIGQVVPADLRLTQTTELECEESVLTGESMPMTKVVDAPAATDGIERSSCALMGTIVTNGTGQGVVVQTGKRTEFGRIAAGLSQRQEITEFQTGLRNFSVLLVQVAGVLTTSIFVINLVLQRPLLESLLFSLAIAVGITPQLLPAVVTTSLAAGSRRLSQQGVLVKRLVCIEDLGDIEVLLTDKTGTLTDGHISFVRGIAPEGTPDDAIMRFGLVCNDATVEHGHAVGGNALDVALWDAAAADVAAAAAATNRLATLPFDHDRRLSSALIDDGHGGGLLVTKGAPESVLAACVNVTPAARETLDAEFAAGSRVVAVATRTLERRSKIQPEDETGLTLAGYLVFLDQPKLDAAASLERLKRLGIEVKVVTGDNALVADKVCRDLGLAVRGVLTGTEIEALDDTALADRVAETTIFARVGPEQKARLVRAHRAAGHDVAFLGDGVNDAVALHAADVGISVESATDVAKDAADIVLLKKDLNVLADGVGEGRRTFANTIKYVLMGTSSNFGNMFSAAAASTFLSFLPMLPGQILLNNLLYDTSQMAIPTDRVDAELLERPAHWDIHFIRRFMLLFGPLSSIFDFLTFGIMLGPFAAGPALFRSGWFVESLATQTLVVFVIRTHRVPFWRSTPSIPLLSAVLGIIAVGIYLPYSPVAHDLGFTALPATFLLVLVGMLVAYLFLVEITKRHFFATVPSAARTQRSQSAARARRLRRRGARWVRPAPVTPSDGHPH
jgi:Mg2+-importing ATPase